jgi:hypothetical protein
VNCFTDPGQAETVKGAVHGALLTLAGMCAIYNVSAWRDRRDPQLAMNAVVYLGLVAYEIRQVTHHWEACR